MKKSFLFVALVLVLALVFTGCEPDSKEEERAAPTWLVGTWANAGATFTIAADYTFTCDLVTIAPPPSPAMPARVLGKLNYTASGLGPNDYLMENMTTAAAGVPEASYTPGNMGIKDAVEAFSGTLIGTLTPNADKTTFTFTGNDPIATGFFGGAGPYTKE